MASTILRSVGFLALAISTATASISHLDHQRRLCLKDPSAETLARRMPKGWKPLAVSRSAQAESFMKVPATGVAVAPHSPNDATVAQEKHLMRSDTSNKFSGSWTGGEKAQTYVAKRSKDSPKMQIQVYYETMCPYCVMFLNQSLGALWQNAELRGTVNISLIPYGNAKSVPVEHISEGYKFWHPDAAKDKNVFICQHGGDECFGNLIQACAIHLEPQEKHMDFITCMAARLGDQSVEKSSYECMESTGMDKQAMKNCVNTPQGNSLMAEMAKQTDAVQGRLGTPWVMIDGENLPDPSHFPQAVCAGLDYGPNSCSSYINPDDYFPVMFQRMLDYNLRTNV